MAELLVPQVVKQLGKDPLRHPPYNPIRQLVGLDQARLSCHIKPDQMVSFGEEELCQWDPCCGRDFRAEEGVGPTTGDEDERPDGDRGKDRSPGDHVLQGSGQVLIAEMETYFFPGFPKRGVQQIGIPALLPPAGQGHVPRPGIAATLGSADKKDRIRVGRQDNRDRRPKQRVVVIEDRLVLVQALAEAGQPFGQCECDWQTPPQHPPCGATRLETGLPPLRAGRAGSEIKRSSSRPAHFGQTTDSLFRISCSNWVSQAIQR
jgi:hypothetical protein